MTRTRLLAVAPDGAAETRSYVPAPIRQRQGYDTGSGRRPARTHDPALRARHLRGLARTYRCDIHPSPRRHRDRDVFHVLAISSDAPAMWLSRSCRGRRSARAELDAVARRWVHEKVEGLWERMVGLFAVWVGVAKKNVARADVKGLIEAVVLEDVRREVSGCAWPTWLSINIGFCSGVPRFEAMEIPEKNLRTLVDELHAHKARFISSVGRLPRLALSPSHSSTSSSPRLSSIPSQYPIG